jgi:acyl-CoA synthetase (AMP-forming)/AMP-acid ligase II
MFDVQAFGVPDPRMGEELCACIRHHKETILSEQQLRAFCKGKVCNMQYSHHKQRELLGRLSAALVPEEKHSVWPLDIKRTISKSYYGRNCFETRI